MNKHEKVRIDLSGGRGSDPPMKLKKTKNKYPSNQNFRFVPKFLPSLEKFVRKVTWDSINKQLKVKILETPCFESFAWFGSINDRYAESQKSSFVDFEQDSLRLYFLDDENREIACFKFKNLKLLDHEVVLETKGCADWGADTCNHLAHKITIQYVDHKVLPIQVDEAEAAAGLSEQEAIDSEWQTVEMAEI